MIVKRMHHPEDILAKRGIAYLGDVIHKYHKFSGTYKGSITNFYPNESGDESITDGAYLVEEDGDERIISMEDESSTVNIKSLKKSYRYSVNMEYAFGLPVESVITTTVPLKNCEKSYWPSKR